MSKYTSFKSYTKLKTRYFLLFFLQTIINRLLYWTEGQHTWLVPTRPSIDSRHNNNERFCNDIIQSSGINSMVTWLIVKIEWIERRAAQIKSIFLFLINSSRSLTGCSFVGRYKKWINFIITLIKFYVFVFCICFDGLVIPAQYTATIFKIYCAPPNLGIRTWICRLYFAQRPIFSGLRFFNEPEISDSGPPD